MGLLEQFRKILNVDGDAAVEAGHVRASMIVRVHEIDARLAAVVLELRSAGRLPLRKCSRGGDEQQKRDDGRSHQFLRS